MRESSRVPQESADLTGKDVESSGPGPDSKTAEPLGMPVHDEYYQVDRRLLEHLPRDSYPLDFFRLHEESASVAPIYRAGDKVDAALRNKLLALADQGLIFVSRSQHDIYTSHIIHQLDLVMQDSRMTTSERAETLFKALRLRQNDFYAEPDKKNLDRLLADVDVLIDCIRQDAGLVFKLICHMHYNNHPDHKRLNVAVMGMAIFMCEKRNELRRFELRDAAAALFLHDVGMSRIPCFILDKAQGLRPDERKRIQEHCFHGVDILARLGDMSEPMLRCVMEHHERIDGSGYPKGLAGSQLSELGRIAAVADSYAAMIADKPYAEGQKPIQAAVELYKDRKHYDHRVTGTLLTMLQEITC